MLSFQVVEPDNNQIVEEIDLSGEGHVLVPEGVMRAIGEPSERFCLTDD